MEQVTAALVNLLVVGIVAGLGYLSQRIGVYFKKEGLLTELESKRAYVNIVVQAINQTYEEAEGPEKLAKAKTQLIDYFQQKKIPFTESELDMLIESSVKSIKDGVKQGIKD